MAYDCHDLDAFRAHLVESGCHPRGQTLVRNDGFGVLKQMFAKGYEAGDPTTSGFPEYVQRPRHDDDALTITFSEGAGRGFYEQIENAVAERRRGTVRRLLEDAERLARARARGRGAAEPGATKPRRSRAGRARH